MDNPYKLATQVTQDKEKKKKKKKTPTQCDPLTVSKHK